MPELRGRRARVVLLALVLWALATVLFTGVAVVLDAAELPPFASSSRWAPVMGAAAALVPAWLVLRARWSR